MMVAHRDEEFPPATGKEVDLRLPLLEEIYRHLMIDDDWSIRTNDAFEWWSFRLRQTIAIGSPRMVSGDATVRIQASTDVVESVEASEDDVRSVLDHLNRETGSSALIWHPADSSVTLDCTLYAHAGNPGLVRIFGGCGLLQNIVAHNMAEDLAQALNAVPSITEHPSSGERAYPDDLLNFGEQVVDPTGAETSRYIGTELRDVATDEQFQWLQANGDERGMTGELPFTSETPAAHRQMIRAVLPHRDESHDPLGTSLFAIATDEANPGQGNGALLTLRLPCWVAPEEAVRIVDVLNRSEAAEFTGVPFLGSWCTDSSLNGHPTLCWVTFIPNFMAAPGLLRTVSGYVVARNQWARRRLAQLGLLI